MRTQLLCVSLWLFTQCLAAQEVQILHEAVSDHPLGSSVQAYSQTKLAEIVEYRTRVEECTAEGCVCVCVFLLSGGGCCTAPAAVAHEGAAGSGRCGLVEGGPSQKRDQGVPGQDRCVEGASKLISPTCLKDDVTLVTDSCSAACRMSDPMT